MKLVHLTDPHLVAPGAHLYGLDPYQRLQAAIQDINARHRDAAFVLVTGDLAHRGEGEAYDALRDLLTELAVPCRLVLGNHDDREAFRRVFPMTHVDEDGFVQYRFETPAGVFVVLDTLAPGSHVGQLCARRLGWLDRQLAACRGTAAYLCMHHAPFAVGLPAMDAIRLSNEAEFASVLASHPHVRHLFFGHLHRPVSGVWRGIPFSTIPATNHQVALEFEARQGVPGSHEPPAYAVVLITEHETIVHTHDYLDRSARFDLFDAETERAWNLPLRRGYFATGPAQVTNSLIDVTDVRTPRS